MKYTFHNRGTVTSFIPDKLATGADGKRNSLLDIHKDLVREAGRRDVYIMDHKGRDVDCSLPLPLSQAA